MRIRGIPGHYTFHPENDKEHAMLNHAWRDARKWFEDEFPDNVGYESPHVEKRAQFYWGDARIDGIEGRAFNLGTWDERDYVDFRQPERYMCSAIDIEHRVFCHLQPGHDNTHHGVEVVGEGRVRFWTWDGPHQNEPAVKRGDEVGDGAALDAEQGSGSS